MENLAKDKAIQTFVRLIALVEVQAQAFEAASKSLRLMIGGWRLAAVPLDTMAPTTLSSPNYDDPNNILDNPLVPEWDEDLLNQVLAAQQQAADFINVCTTKFHEELQHAAQMANPTTRAQATAHALERYQQCLNRPHPQQVSGTDSP